jgi:hypothetical protein
MFRILFSLASSIVAVAGLGFTEANRMKSSNDNSRSSNSNLGGEDLPQYTRSSLNDLSAPQLA